MRKPKHFPSETMEAKLAAHRARRDHDAFAEIQGVLSDDALRAYYRGLVALVNRETPTDVLNKAVAGFIANAALTWMRTWGGEHRTHQMFALLRLQNQVADYLDYALTEQDGVRPCDADMVILDPVEGGNA